MLMNERHLPTNLTDMISDVPFHHNICSWKPFPLVQNRGKVEFLICLTIAVVYQVLYSWMVFSSVQFSRSVMSNSLRPHESQHARPPCPSQLPEFTQTHAHWVSDAIQPSHPLSSPSPPTSNPSQDQGLFQWVNSLHEVAKVLEFQL